MVEYCDSLITKDYFCAMVDNVVVAFWSKSRWIEFGTYRPFRNHLAKKVKWANTPYDVSTLFDKRQFEIVKTTGRESISELIDG